MNNVENKRMENAKAKIAYISSNGVNAYSLSKACSSLGYKTYSLKDGLFLEKINLQEIHPSSVILITEEDSLIRIIQNNHNYIFFPNSIAENMIDDKLTVSNFVKDIGLETIQVFQNQKDVKYPAILKSRYSWKNGHKLTRGYILNSSDELENKLMLIKSSGFSREDFFIQEFISGPFVKNISVCGYFDSNNPESSALAVVERVLSKSVGLSCSSVVATVTDSHELIKKTKLILTKMNYQGPFEVEFMVTEFDVYFLELNPRFWLQNEIFLPWGNLLLKKYFKKEDQVLTADFIIGKTVWIDGFWLVQNLIRFQFRSIVIIAKYLFNDYKVVTSPGVLFSLNVLIRKKISSFHHRIFG